MIKQLSTKKVYKNPWMVVREDVVEFPNGHQGIYGIIDKPDFALVIPFDGLRFYLVKQYRYPISKTSIEFPQGKHKENSQMDPLELAKEELLEETGLVAEKIIEIGFLYEAPGYSNQGFHIFFATGLTQKETKLDVTETDLETLTMSPGEFEQAIDTGKITDASTVSAYGLLKIKKIL